MTTPHRCLSPDCPRLRYRRGLCPKHYRQACEAVAKGEATWQALEAAGDCLPAKKSPWRGARPAGRK
jgi:hypothetical protein